MLIKMHFMIFIDLCKEIYEQNPQTITNQFIRGFSSLASYKPKGINDKDTLGIQLVH